MEVMIPDFGGKTLHLVPAAYKAEDPTASRTSSTAVMKPPVRVKGEFLQDRK
jgi:hypothetical protein